MESTRVGAQRPRICVEPKRAYTDGGNAADLSAAYGNVLDEWQRLVLDCWLGRDGDGRLTATTCGIPVPRQNGKNGIIEAFELCMLLCVPNTHILHTAHQVKTEKKAFRRLAGIFEDRRHAELNGEVECVRRTNGEEAIELKNGNTIEYASRSRGGGRGFDAITCVVYDECQELTDDQVEALMSTLAASPTGDRQTIYAGTPPSPTAPGDVFRRVRRAALDSPTPHTAWHEWSVDGDCCPVRDGMGYGDVRDMVFETNPAMGVRLSDEFTQEEFATMTAHGFARERLGWWGSDDVFDAAIPSSEWKACEVEKPTADGYISFGIKFHGKMDKAALSACVRGEPPHVELVDVFDTTEGVGFIADWLCARSSTTVSVAIDGRSAADALVDALKARRYPMRAVIVSSPATAIASASMFRDAVLGRNLTHIASPALDTSACGSTRRKIGNAGGWGFGDGLAESLAVESAALAYYANRVGKRDPGRKMRVL